MRARAVSAHARTRMPSQSLPFILCLRARALAHATKRTPMAHSRPRKPGGKVLVQMWQGGTLAPKAAGWGSTAYIVACGHASAISSVSAGGAPQGSLGVSDWPQVHPKARWHPASDGSVTAITGRGQPLPGPRDHASRYGRGMTPAVALPVPSAAPASMMIGEGPMYSARKRGCSGLGMLMTLRCIVYALFCRRL